MTDQVVQSELRKVKKPRKTLLGLILLVAIYILSPIDLLPEAFLGPLGYLDDIGLLAYLVKQLIKR